MSSIDFNLSDEDIDRIADAVVAKLKDVASVTSKPADKPADKPATKPAPKKTEAKKPDPAPAEEPPAEDAVPEQADVLTALRTHSTKHGRPSALKVLAEYAGGSDKATDVPEDKRADLIKALEAEPAAEEDF
jgi:outer membrane biosynthesis protein TonB